MRLLKTIALAFLIACFWSSPAFAAADLPAIVNDGLTAYQKLGSRAAMETWIKGSALANSEDADRLENLLSNFEGTYGKMIGSEVIGTKVFSPSSERIYLLIKLEKHPLYAALDCYKTPEGWIIPSIGFNLEPQDLLPAAFFNNL